MLCICIYNIHLLFNIHLYIIIFHSYGRHLFVCWLDKFTRDRSNMRVLYIFFYIYIYICICICIYKARMLDRVACEPPQKYPPKCFVRKLFTLLGNVSIWGGRFFDFLGSKNIFKPCHHIEFNSQNPNPILKITISFTETPKKPKHFRKKRKL